MTIATPSPSPSERAEYRAACAIERWKIRDGGNGVNESLLRDRIVEAITAAEQAARPQWLPIETAPRDGTRIHLGFLHLAQHDVIAHWSGDDWSLSGSDWYATRLHGRPEPTHWMPLPEPPSKETV